MKADAGVWLKDAESPPAAEVDGRGGVTVGALGSVSLLHKYIFESFGN